MSTSVDRPVFKQLTRTGQIIFGVMIVPEKPGAARPATIGLGAWHGWPITAIAIFLAVTGLPVTFLLPRLIASSGRRQLERGMPVRPRASGDPGMIDEFPSTEEVQWAMIYQTLPILVAAMNEG